MKPLSIFVVLIFASGYLNAQNVSIEFLNDGVFIVPEDTYSLTIEVLGAGGSGGGNGTGGGGGGGYASGEYPVTPGQELIVTIGLPGVDAITGTSSVDNLISATGGENGVSVNNPEIGGGGNGGQGTGGTILNCHGGQGGGGYYTYFGGGGGGAAGMNGNGGDGGNTIAWSGICQTPGGSGGQGGGYPGGDGGKGAGFTDEFCNVSDPAEDGFDYGAGGGGGNGNGGGPGSGNSGIVIISYCIVTSEVSIVGNGLMAEQEGAQYQWIDCLSKGSWIDGATEQYFEPEENGMYAVIIDLLGCATVSDCIEISTIGMEELTNSSAPFYPNPFSDHLNLINPQFNIQYEMFNSSGQLIWSGTNPSATSFNDIPEGLYIIRSTVSEEVFRLIRE